MESTKAVMGVCFQSNISFQGPQNYNLSIFFENNNNKKHDLSSESTSKINKHTKPIQNQYYFMYLTKYQSVCKYFGHCFLLIKILTLFQFSHCIIISFKHLSLFAIKIDFCINYTSARIGKLLNKCLKVVKVY